MAEANLQGILTTMFSQIDLSNTYKGDDGLLYCSKCHTLRVTDKIIPVFNAHMPTPCECMKQETRKQEERLEYMRKMDAIDKIRSASLLGDRYKDTTFENTEMVGGDFAKAFQRCRKYCDIHEEALANGYGIYLYGTSGTGKTHLTACICNELIRQLQQCLFTNFFEIAKLIRSTFTKNIEAETIIKRICDVDFLFIDDLGTEMLKRNGEDNWLQEQVFDIINKRYNQKKPTIFSSNYSLNELIEQRGMMEKTVDRIMEMSTAIIKINGASYRAKNRGKGMVF